MESAAAAVNRRGNPASAAPPVLLRLQARGDSKSQPPRTGSGGDSGAPDQRPRLRGSWPAAAAAADPHRWEGVPATRQL
ncbi:hypothetical protein U9M48_005098 [Paspalum notatum var. saurae]|uniref:Uncharacterized protein n=1 Tax=Paspalum notatum var. saurae TaxID=547442 RepID=A0AAQ3SLP2_PASNO